MDAHGLYWTIDNKKALIVQGFLYFFGLSWIIIGGSAWESNPPGTLFTPHTGFEVQEAHQRPVHFRVMRRKDKKLQILRLRCHAQGMIDELNRYLIALLHGCGVFGQDDQPVRLDHGF